MTTRHADRLWIGAGAVIVTALALMSWFFVISPKYAEAADYRSQTADTELQVVSLRKKIAELQTQMPKLAQYRQELQQAQAALPSDSGVPAFLRQLQASGTAVDVEVSGLNVGTPEEDPSVGGVWALPLQLTATGTAANLGRFLDQLQGSGQKRAVLIEAVNLAPDGATAMSLSVTAKAFVAPEAGAGAPAVVTD